MTAADKFNSPCRHQLDESDGEFIVPTLRIRARDCDRCCAEIVEAAKDAGYILGVSEAVVRIESWADNVLDVHPESAGRSILLKNVAAAVRELARDRIAALAPPAKGPVAK